MNAGSQDANARRDILTRWRGPLPYFRADFDAATLELLGPAVASAPNVNIGLARDLERSNAVAGDAFELVTQDLGSPLGVVPVVVFAAPMLVSVTAHLSLVATTSFDAAHLGELDAVILPAALTFVEFIEGDRKDGTWIIGPGRLAGNAQVELDARGIARVAAGDRLLLIANGSATETDGTIGLVGFGVTPPRVELAALEVLGAIVPQT